MARRPKTREEQRRRGPRYEPKDRMLIVCEGEKTEKLYFEDARQAFRIHPGLAKVTVEVGSGSNPRNIVATASRMARQASRQGNAFTSVHCVFDRDEHAHYEESVQKADRLGLRTIKSVPCFEYWLLLHFRSHAAPYSHSGDRSPGQCCLRDLLAEWPDYEKAKADVFSALQGEPEEVATQRAVQRLQAAAAEDSDNPTTEVHLLLAAMRELNSTRPVKE